MGISYDAICFYGILFDEAECEVILNALKALGPDRANYFSDDDFENAKTDYDPAFEIYEGLLESNPVYRDTIYDCRFICFYRYGERYIGLGVEVCDGDNASRNGVNVIERDVALVLSNLGVELDDARCLWNVKIKTG